MNRALITYREPVMDMQFVQERIASAAMEMFASACVLSRLDRSCKAWEETARPPPGSHRAAEPFPAPIVPPDPAVPERPDGQRRQELLATADAVLGKENPGAAPNGR